MKAQQSGFTLIELIMVIVILGILAATALPKFISLQDDAGQAGADGVAGSIGSGAAINKAGKLLGKATAQTLNQANVCTATILGGVIDGGIPSGYTISGTGDCSGTAESVSCTVTNTKTSKTSTASVLCAR